MVEKILYALGILMVTVSTSYCEILRTNDYGLIHDILKIATADTLVIFDIDDVIMQPSDQIMKSPCKPHLLVIEADLATRYSPEEVLNFKTIALAAQQPQLVDHRVLESLALLKKNNITTLAITYCPTGKHGKIGNFEDWRIEMLKQLSIDFRTLNNITDHRFTEITASHGVPLIKSGIAITALAKKGIVLDAILKKEKLHPKKIIFIDDKITNLQSVQTTALKNNIAFIGIEYTVVKKGSKLEPVNKIRANKQFELLEKDNVWRTDKEVDAILGVL